jgi:hypothetical protein
MAVAIAAVTGVVVVIINAISNDDSSPPASGDLAIVIGAHSNAPMPKLVGRMLSTAEVAVRNRQSIKLILNSGSPQVLDPYRGDCINSFACQQDTARLESLVERESSSSPGNNLLDAIDVASRALSDETGTKTLGIIDSGLQTAWPLQFQDSSTLIDADAGDIVQYVESKGPLPNLKGIHVILSGIGDTAAPQGPLNIGQRDALVGIWTAICNAAGAASVYSERFPLTTAPHVGQAPVPTVSISSPAIPASVGPASRFVVPDKVLGFIPDTANFIDRGATLDLLKPIAVAMSTLHGNLLLTGTTAKSGTVAGQLSISLARANAVERVLVELGVPAARITTRGVGTNNPGYVPDVDQDGRLLPGPAAANRTVIVQLPAR